MKNIYIMLWIHSEIQQAIKYIAAALKHFGLRTLFSHVLRTPNSSCLCRLSILILHVSEIKTEIKKKKQLSCGFIICFPLEILSFRFYIWSQILYHSKVWTEVPFWYTCSIVLAPFVAKTILFLLSYLSTFVKNQLSMQV